MVLVLIGAAQTAGDPALRRAVAISLLGLLDAPHLCGNPLAAGQVFTQIKEGACMTVDLETGKVLSEEERLASILKT